jgi:hypothetical protein
MAHRRSFGAQSHGLWTRRLRFVASVAADGARLATGCWPSFARTGLITRWVPLKGFRSVSYIAECASDTTG